MAPYDVEVDQVAEKLQLIKSPVVNESADDSDPSTGVHKRPTADVEDLGFRGDPYDEPSIRKYDDATNLEVFFDLFFAANLTVFGESQTVTKPEKFTSYIGYFAILWFTWAVVGLYDVRFVTDSIFQRCAKAVHLGVMVGFAVVAPNWSPHEPNMHTMKTFSLILMVSRLALAVEYGSVIWHVRKYRKGKLPLAIMVGLNIVVAMIYLGISFAFQPGVNRVYYSWYIVAVFEIVSNVGLSFVWKVLSFQGTHLIRRMAILTVIMLGEGIIVVCQNCATIVKNPASWTSATIGVVTAAASMIYFVFMLYFDNLRHQHLPGIRQQLWCFLHFPIHLALVLFMEGSTQFIIWWKILEIEEELMNKISSVLSALDDSAIITTQQVVNSLNTTVEEFITQFPPTYTASYVSIQDFFANISSIPDEFWSNDAVDENDPLFQQLISWLSTLLTTLDNILMNKFKIDYTQDVSKQLGDSADLSLLQSTVNQESWSRFNLVFQYAFATSGIVLVLLCILYVLQRVEKWKPWHIIRITITALLGIGLALTSLVSISEDAASAFEISPWLLPSMCLVYFFVLILNHIPHPPPLFFAKKTPKATAGGSDGSQKPSWEQAPSS